LNQFPLSLNANAFLEHTKQFVFQGLNPGGRYTAIWSRDASYIINDWFVSGGNLNEILEQICLIWSHQIEPGKEKIIYGRGSPESGFQPSIAGIDIEIDFKGALPTTIYYQHDFCEVYGKSPDIDSTALMVSTTSWILSSLLKNNTLSTMSGYPWGKLKLNKQSMIFDQLIPKMIRAIDYLIRLDIDGDCLLEQNYNEDWMDTTLRIGKIVYSQATWILALKNFSILLFELGNKKTKTTGLADKVLKLAEGSIEAVEQKLWSQRNHCYIDSIQTETQIDFESGILTQDVLLFLLANAKDECLIKNSNGSKHIRSSKDDDANNDSNNDRQKESRIYYRAIETLNTIRTRIWKGGMPLVTEAELVRTGPIVLRPNQYHNYTCWPWVTAIEMLARSKFDMLEEQDVTLLSMLISEDNRYAFYEWIDPITESGHGAFPFRTGISCIRLALAEILKKNQGTGNF
jgi:hypothetical protein